MQGISIALLAMFENMVEGEMARTRSENYDGIQNGILTAAAGLFARQGYGRTSITDLADACGQSRGALYHYFDSKEAILFALLDSHVRRMIADVDAAIAKETDALKQFQGAISAIVLLNAKSSSEQRLILHDLPFLSEDDQQRIKGLERKLVETIAGLLDALDRHGKIVKSNRKVYTMLLFGMLNYSHTWYQPTRGVPPAEFADTIVNQFLGGLLSPKAAPLSIARAR